MLSIFLITFLTACAGDIDALAKQGDWFAVGEQDGVRGLPSRSLSDLNKLAEKTGSINLSVGNYEAGYHVGIEKYCDVNNAYEIGLSGMQYLGVCAYRADGLRFRMEWQRGYDYFSAVDSSY